MGRESQIDVIGVLADDEYVYDRTGARDSVFINSLQVLQFNVKVLSKAGASSSLSLCMGYATDLEKYGFVEDRFADTSMEEQLRQFLSSSAIIFRPMQSGNGRYYRMSNVRLRALPLSHDDATTYLQVPVFSQAAHNLTFAELMQKLQNNQAVGRIPHIVTERTARLPYLIWQEADGSYLAVGQFSTHNYGYSGFQFVTSGLKAVPLTEACANGILDVPDDSTLLFVTDKTNQAILDSLELAEPYSEHALVQPEPEAVATTVVATAQPVLPLPGPTEEEAQQPPANEEAEFLRSLLATAREAGLLYDEADLINFHTAMKTSSLVILAGMSGTGKSRLVQVYAQALGLGDRFGIIPVRPSWTDDADLLGYVDGVHMVYKPGDSGLVDTLIEASQKQHLLYLICFDEMNLARVEHYFSQFLSVLELDQSRRYLRLYSADLEARLYNQDKYPALLPIGDNVLFVGTVNLDESTYHFSDKVLDRANVIKLNVLPFHGLRNLSEERRRATERPEVSLAQYRAFVVDDGKLTLTDREVEFLTKLHRLLHSASNNLGVGFRVVRQMNSYLANLPEAAVFSRADAFDLQVVQRVLTKLRGPEDQLRPVLGSFQAHKGAVENSPLLQLLTEYADVSAFQVTNRVIEQKAKELKFYGYTV